MRMFPVSSLIVSLIIVVQIISPLHAADKFREISRLDSPQAVQAAVTFGGFVFAVNNREIAKYNRKTGEFMGLSSGDAIHLNSGFVWKKQILCAHSNYPKIPERSQVMALNPTSMKLKSWHDFYDYGGSLTWIVRRGNRWLCNFARYGDANEDTFLVEFDNDFQERFRWKYPPDLIARLGNYSLSGGVWYQDRLLVTGHDEQEIYVLKIPRKGNTLEFHQTIDVPFTGQGISVDSTGKGLVGINRAKRQVIFIR